MQCDRRSDALRTRILDFLRLPLIAILLSLGAWSAIGAEPAEPGSSSSFTRKTTMEARGIFWSTRPSVRLSRPDHRSGSKSITNTSTFLVL